jgi:hypothetical protein
MRISHGAGSLLLCALLCSAAAGEWSIIDPPPTGENLTDVWGSASNDVFAVGSRGTILHYDGENWSQIHRTTGGRLQAVWGTGPSNVLAGGLGGILLHDGTEWVSMGGAPNAIEDIWGTARDDVFAVTRFSLFHYNGATWNDLGHMPLDNIWTARRGSIISAGRLGQIRHGDLTGQEPTNTPTRVFLRTIWGLSTNALYAAGDHGTVLHYDGTSWQNVPTPTTNNIYCLWGADTNCVFAAGGFGMILRYDGDSWLTMPTGTRFNINGIWGSGTNCVFAVGDAGTILHYDGRTASPVPRPSDDTDGDGYRNAYELRHGTDWTNTASFPAPTLHVEAAAPDGGDGSRGNPFRTIQAAIGAAGDYDVIGVGDGVYSGPGNRDIDFLGKPVMIVSTGSVNRCVINCKDQAYGFLFQSGESPLSVIDGLTITDGDEAAVRIRGACPTIQNCIITDNDGGIECRSSSPEIRNCTIKRSIAFAGIYLDYSSPLISGCDILDNTAQCGVYCQVYSFPLISDCRLRKNAGWNGGGLECRPAGSHPTLVDCLITDNTAFDDGGGIDCHPTASVTVRNCALSGNEALDEGGGVRCTGTTPALFTGCRIVGNTSPQGGGVQVDSDTHVVLQSCFIRDNTAERGAGVFVNDNARLLMDNCTIVDNIATSGGGLYADGGTSLVSNCILWDNQPDQVATNRHDLLSISHSCIESGHVGTANIDADPQFATTFGPILRLKAASPCVDSANDGTAPATDFEGESRWKHPDSPPAASLADMGADEFVDRDLDGMADAWELAHFGTLDITATNDVDGDGLPALDEYEYGTDPGLGDTDNDGLTDAREVGQTGTHPVNPDTDGDGLSDGWEVTLGYDALDPAVPAGLDTDEDGDAYLKLYELTHGSDPASPGSVPAPDIYVDASAAPGGSGTALAPFNTIANALAIADPNAIIELKDGTYRGADNRNISYGGKVVMITSAHGGERCVIDCEGEGSGFSFTGEETRLCVLDGLTISNASSSGVRCEYADPTIQRCRLVHNQAWDGGGLYCYRSEARVKDCELLDNTALDDGGGLFARYSDLLVTGTTLAGNRAGDNGGGIRFRYGQLRAHDCAIEKNTAAWYGGGINGSDADAVLERCTINANRSGADGGGAFRATLRNCTLADNVSGNDGGGAFRATLRNCTLADNVSGNDGGGCFESFARNCAFVRNRADDDGGGAHQSSLNSCTITGNSALDLGGGVRDSTLTNCIVYHNTARGDANYGESTFSHSCTTPDPGGNNITGDPLLASPTHLSSGSPCIAAGIFASCFGTDIDGEAWQDPPCIGCDQYAAGSVTGALHVAILAEWTDTVPSLPLEFAADIRGRTSRGTWSFGDGAATTNRPAVSHAWTTTGGYDVVLTAFNETYPDGVAATVRVSVAEQTFYHVDPTGLAPQAPYGSWEHAATNIQDAVDACRIGATVLVTNGVYATGGRLSPGGLLASRIVIDKAITVRSVNGPGVTRIVGQGPVGDFAVRCAYLGGGAALSGFTLTNGHTLAAGTGTDQSGGGAFAEGAMLTNCVIAGNVAGLDGGGICYGTLYDCLVTGNAANDDGGGLCKCEVYDSTISGNTAADNGGGSQQGALHRCTLAGNRAERDGGGANGSVLSSCLVLDNRARDDGGGADGGTLHNCTVSGNGAGGDGGGVRGAALVNCIVYRNSADSGDNISGGNATYTCTSAQLSGAGNIHADPQLNPSYRPRSSSPCIDARTLSGAPALDVDGEPRWDHPGHSNVVSAVDMGADEFVDADTDGAADLWEIELFGNTNRNGGADEDHDLLTNADEYSYGTDPFDADTDGDRFRDNAEIIAGTNPLDPADYLEIAGWDLDPVTGALTLRWETVSDRVYTVQTSPHPLGTWTDLHQAAGTGWTRSFTIPGGTAHHLYIRIRVHTAE